MKRTLAAALLLATPACFGGGSSTEPTPGVPTVPSPAETGTAAPSVTVSPAARHGSAEVTYEGVGRAWPERACETTRGADGRVVGWMATFQDADEQSREYRMGDTSSRHYVQIRLRRYTGDGRYPSAQIALRLVGGGATPDRETGFGVPGQRLVLRDGGHSGTYTTKGVRVTFTCDPADDTSTDDGQALPETPAAGTAYVVRPDGAAFRFTDVRCDMRGQDTEVVAGAFPHFFRVRTRATDGDRAGARVLLGLHGVVLPLNPPDATAEVSGDPVESGTWRAGPGGGDVPNGATRAAFACG